jgi:hypothetical protein
MGERGSIVSSWLLAAFLVAHGLIHASYLRPPPAVEPGAPPWPFRLERSWALAGAGAPVEAVRATGRVLVLLVVAAFALAGIGVLAGAAWWGPVTLVAATLSLVQLGLFFHPWLSLGVLIDAVLIAGVTVGWPWTLGPA